MKKKIKLFAQWKMESIGTKIGRNVEAGCGRSERLKLKIEENGGREGERSRKKVSKL